jgi:hypothetical protein
VHGLVLIETFHAQSHQQIIKRRASLVTGSFRVLPWFDQNQRSLFRQREFFYNRLTGR